MGKREQKDAAADSDPVVEEAPAVVPAAPRMRIEEFAGQSGASRVMLAGFRAWLVGREGVPKKRTVEDWQAALAAFRRGGR